MELVRNVTAAHRSGKSSYAELLPQLFWKDNSRFGGHLVHLGIVLIALGVIGSTFFATSADATLKRNESMTIKGYTLTYTSLDSSQTANRAKVWTDIQVTRDGKSLGTMRTEKTFTNTQEQPVTEVAIRSTAAEDLYVILVGWSEDGSTADLKV
jgi:cytochrome c-type biogenesis protein CcmF